MAILSSETILNNILTELADNNAGLISAYDVRHNLADTVESINTIVSSGNFNTQTPFVNNNVRAKIKVVGSERLFGRFIAESGVEFPNASGELKFQTEPYPGPFGIAHNSLAGLNQGDPHSQYININGSRVMSGDLGLGSNWINSSGEIGLTTPRGLKFEYLSNQSENVVVASGTKFVFDSNKTTIEDGRGVARAWINFSASGGTILVREAYNIKQIERQYSGSPPTPSVGKFIITFESGVLANNNYVALAQSNSRSDNDEGSDFDINTVGVVQRTGDDAASLRQMTFYVVNDAGEYVDAAMNDLVVYGRNRGSMSGVQPIVIN